jgi:hypothetical protein
MGTMTAALNNVLLLSETIPASGLSGLRAGEVMLLNTDATLDASTTIPEGGLVLGLSTGHLRVGSNTFTCNAEFSAQQGFRITVDAGGSVIFGQGSTRRVLPQWFGAIGDGVRDDRAALSRAATAAVAAKADLELTPGDTYRVTSNLTIAAGTCLVGAGVIKPDPSVAVTVNCRVDSAHKLFDTSLGGTVSVVSWQAVAPEWFGAVGDDSTDDTAAIQAAVNSLSDNGVITFRPATTYKVTDTITFDDVSQITVYGNGAIIRPRSVSFAEKAVLKFVDTPNARVIKIGTFNTLGGPARPACSVAVGRSTPSTSCSGLQFEHCDFRGYATVGSLYRSGAELLVFRHCEFINSQNAPAYYDDDADYKNIFGRNGTGASNTECAFYDCTFRSYIGNNDGCIIWITHNCKDLAFYHCYSTPSDGNGGRGWVFRIEKDLAPANGGVDRFVIDDWRAETNDDGLLDQRGNRFMYVNNGNELSGFEIKNVFLPATGTPAPPDYAIELALGGFTHSYIDLKDSEDIYTTRMILVGAGTTIESSIITVRKADDISCAGTVSDCILRCVDGSIVPCTGAGEYSNNHVIGTRQKTYQLTGLYDFAVNGGTQIDHTLFAIPDNATVTRAWYEVLTPFASGGAATVAFGVATDDALGIKGATAYNHGDYGAGYHDFLPDGTAANFTTKTTAGRNVIMTVAGANLTAGKVRVWCECSVSE